MDRSVEKFVEALKKNLRGDLLSIVLYGSAASGDFEKKYSDYNVMVVVEELGLEHLKRLAPLTRKWVCQGNAMPLLVRPVHIETSKDVFAIEFADMRDNHKVLYGRDFVKDIIVDREHLRLQCEREIKADLLALRGAILERAHSRRKLKNLLLKSSSSFMAILRGVLRVQEETPPLKKRELLEKINEKAKIDMSVFKKILDAREGVQNIRRSEVMPLLEQYLTTLQEVASYVDEL